MFRFGITMRETKAIGYNELRDSLAQDWGTYMSTTFPSHNWLSIPNIGPKAIDYFIKWGLNVLILSGGDSIGASENRDNTELYLLKYAIENNIPIIGICRGLQLIHSYFGGKIKIGEQQFINEHRAHDHEISLNNKTYLSNSFHVNQIVEETLNKEFKIIATCSKYNSIEAIKGKNILAMMWHPERKMKDKLWSNNLIFDFLINFE